MPHWEPTFDKGFTFSIHTQDSLNELKGVTLVYGIIREDKYIYIGKTKDIVQRFKDHKLIEDTDIIHIWIPGGTNVGTLEARLIQLFKPKYNIRGLK